MKYALTIAIMLSLSFGLVTESFRYQSTAQLWEDDYDLLFDPARIPEIEGARLWTGLSNFVTGYEELFSNTSVPYFFIGGTKNYGNYYPGFVYDRSSMKDALNTGLIGPGGTPLYGDGEVTTIDWQLDTLGQPISRTVDTQTASAYDATASSDFYVGLGVKRDNLRLGLGFMKKDSKNTITNPMNNFTYEFSSEDLEADTLTYLETENSAGDEIFSDNENRIIFSAWSDRDNMSLGLTGEFAMLDLNEEAIITGAEAEYDFPEHRDTSFMEIATIDSAMKPQSGTRIAVEVKCFYDYNEDAQGRFYLGYSTESYDYGDNAMDWSYMTSEESYNYFQWDTNTTITYYEGSTSNSGFRVGTKQLFNVSDRLNFGIGFFFGSTSYSNSITSRDTTVDITVYDDGDTVSNDPDDFTATMWSSQTWQTDVDGSIKNFTIPIGAEFHIADPLVFRLGARHNISYNEYTTIDTLVDYEPERTLIEYGDGTTYEDIDQAYDDDYSKEVEKVTLSSTDYYYGLGWKVTDNLQLDLMGFSDLTDMTNWRLSATFYFD
ncbi:hypothetical protein ES705_32611 [subsurface metagenome]